MPFAPRFLASTSRAACAGALLALLASCSGSVDPSPNVVDPTAISILPSGTAATPVVLYSGLPTEFVISGGTGQYIVTSNNQAALPVAQSGVGSRLTVVPNPVAAATAVTLNVRDTGVTPQTNVIVDVRPGTVTNSIQIVPTITDCAPGVCSGGDAVVTVVISQGGVPLPARGVRFDVVQGAFRFITTAPGVLPELTELSTTAVTDETGRARVRIRATALAPNQTALIQVTDIGSGAFQRVAFPIVQFTGNNPAFFALPNAITFTGPFIGQCATNSGADFVVFGGTPPYSIVNSFVGFAVTPQTVLTSGGRFTVSFTSSSGCITNAPISITDATGRTIVVTVTNREGTAAAPPTPVTLTPQTLTLNCGASASFTAFGGGGTYSASSNHPRVTALAAATGGTVTVTRLAGDGGATYPTSATITVTDGLTSDTSTVSIVTTAPAPLAANTCP